MTDQSSWQTLGVSGIAVTVSDVDVASHFYTSLLGFSVVGGWETTDAAFAHLFGVRVDSMKVVRLKLGEEQLDLVQFDPVGARVPADSRSNDHWFQHIAVITSDMDKADESLSAASVDEVSNGPQTLPDWNMGVAGIRAFYFHDPDGHNLEVLQFPKDKGDERWHRNDDLFLGIDHTALVVRDTIEGLVFYKELLGLDVAGGSENWGVEQERLNNVAGAHLKITTLRGMSGPGVEFLEYLTPNGGRPIPQDFRPNDLAYWQVSLRVSSVEAASAALEKSGYSFLSTGVVRLTGYSAAVVRDPTGHAVLLSD